MTTITEQLDRLQALCEAAPVVDLAVIQQIRADSTLYAVRHTFVESADDYVTHVATFVDKAEAEAYVGTRQAMPKLIAALSLVFEQDRKRGYPTGAEWTDLLMRIKEGLEGL